MAIWLGVNVIGLVLWLGGGVAWWKCGLGMDMFCYGENVFCLECVRGSMVLWECFVLIRIVVRFVSGIVFDDLL